VIPQEATWLLQERWRQRRFLHLGAESPGIVRIPDCTGGEEIDAPAIDLFRRRNLINPSLCDG
jgi:hypothetical protein